MIAYVLETSSVGLASPFFLLLQNQPAEGCCSGVSETDLHSFPTTTSQQIHCPPRTQGFCVFLLDGQALLDKGCQFATPLDAVAGVFGGTLKGAVLLHRQSDLLFSRWANNLDEN